MPTLVSAYAQQLEQGAAAGAKCSDDGQRELEAPSFALGLAGGVHPSGREPAALPL